MTTGVTTGRRSWRSRSEHPAQVERPGGQPPDDPGAGDRRRQPVEPGRVRAPSTATPRADPHPPPPPRPSPAGGGGTPRRSRGGRAAPAGQPLRTGGRAGQPPLRRAHERAPRASIRRGGSGRASARAARSPSATNTMRRSPSARTAPRCGSLSSATTTSLIIESTSDRPVRHVDVGDQRQPARGQPRRQQRHGDDEQVRRPWMSATRLSISRYVSTSGPPISNTRPGRPGPRGRRPGSGRRRRPRSAASACAPSAE